MTQFLYQFAKTGNHGKDLLESYAFNGGETFSIGGNLDDYEDLNCAGGVKDELFESEVKPMEKENALADYIPDRFQTHPTYWKSEMVMPKVSNYAPPMDGELDEQIIAVDTWSRDLVLPDFFYQYFLDTFMLPAYTCDAMRPQDLVYPGKAQTYSCYCNNGDFHAMPTINVELGKVGYQFDVGPDNYMNLPYLNYTQPMSLCVLGIDVVKEPLHGLQYLSFGQRQLSKFPYFAIYDRATDTGLFELGGATNKNNAGPMGLEIGIAIGVCVIMIVLLLYLIMLRKDRLTAEDWLEAHRKILFTHAACLRCDDDILEELLKHEEKQRELGNHHRPTTPQHNMSKSKGFIEEHTYDAPLLNNDKEGLEMTTPRSHGKQHYDGAYEKDQGPYTAARTHSGKSIKSNKAFKEDDAPDKSH